MLRKVPRFKSTAFKYFIILVILIIAYNIFNFFNSRENPKPNLVPYNLDNLTQISFENISNKFWLSKQNNIWNVMLDTATYPADPTIIENFISSLERSRIEAIASLDKASQVNFGVSEDRPAINLTFEDGTNFKFFVGLTTSFTNQDSYVRIDNSDNTVTISPNLNPIARYDAPAWIDRTIAKFDNDKISNISISSPNLNIILNKAEKSNWSHNLKSKQNLKVSNDKLDSILNQLSNLQGASITLSKPNTSRASRSITVTTADNKTVTIYFYRPDTNGFVPASVADKSYIINLSEYTTNLLFPKLDELLVQ